MSWFNELQVWIPAQGASTRVKNKNTRKFHKDLSLLQIKIKQLSKALDSSQIVVSSESEEALNQAKDLGCSTILRGSLLTGNDIKQSDLFEHFFNNTKTSKYVLWCQVTDPLFNDFENFLKYPLEPGKTRVLASELHKHAFFKGLPLNFQFGLWHKVTQDIEPLLIPRWSCFLHDYDTLKTLNYHFGIDNDFYLTDSPLVDIDTHYDFQNAQILFSQLNAESA